jgi:hypothetical protein
MEIFKTLAEASVDLPNQLGLIGGIVGDNGIGQFAGQFKKVGEGINNLIKALTDGVTLDENSVKVVEIASKILSALAEIGSSGSATAKFNIGTLTDNLGKLGDELIGFITKFSNVDTSDIDSLEGKINKLISVINTLLTIDTASLTTLSDSLKKAGDEAIKSFVDSVNANQPKEDAANAVKNIVGAMKTAADEQKTEVKNKFNEVGEQAYQGVNWDNDRGQWRYFSFFNLGKNFVEGFANGITNNKYLAGNAGTDLGNYALNKAKESIDSHSPSKETYKLGNYFGEGFINGIIAYKEQVGQTASTVGSYARDSLHDAIEQAQLIASSDIDSEPTIRPILDLSNVENGSRYLNSLFTGSTYSLDANLSAISRGMNSRLQNGANDDVVSAIDSLSKNLGNVHGDTYNVNGITYDNGSEISEAVKTLIGAVVNKRRI